MSDYRSDRERIHADLESWQHDQRRADSAGAVHTDFMKVHHRDVEYLLHIADVTASVAKCEVSFNDKPRGFTCLDRMSEAADMSKPYSDQYRAEILRGVGLCDGCQLRAALGAF